MNKFRLLEQSPGGGCCSFIWVPPNDSHGRVQAGRGMVFDEWCSWVGHIRTFGTMPCNPLLLYSLAFE